MVLFTAGAPGAGKSTRLNELGLLGGCRVIDPDAYKERLIARLTELDDPWLMRATRKVEAVLGLKVAPLEMAAVVHEESLYLAEIAFREALRTSEQVCFAGTCSNEAFVRRLLRLVRAAGREECCVLLVEVPEHVALHRAERRWWEGRQAFEQGDNALGARYLPTAVISSSFAEGTSVAARTVERIRAIPEAGIRLVIYDG